MTAAEVQAGLGIQANHKSEKRGVVLNKKSFGSSRRSLKKTSAFSRILKVGITGKVIRETVHIKSTV